MEYTQEDRQEYARIESELMMENDTECGLIQAKIMQINKQKKKRLKYLLLQDISNFLTKWESSSDFDHEQVLPISDRVAALELAIRTSMNNDGSVGFILAGLIEYLGGDALLNQQVLVFTRQLMEQLYKWIGMCYRDGLKNGYVLYLPSFGPSRTIDIREFQQLAIFSY